MLKLSGLIVSLILLAIVSCSRAQPDEHADVLIKTELGDIKIVLFDDTPEHKKNFIKLAREGFYDGVLFHRVMPDFMIQGGDPNSKNAEAGTRLGVGNPGYTIPAEIKDKYYHKKGAVAAARKGGPSNPDKRSSGSQFYIVQGFVHRTGQLDTMELAINNRAKNEILKEKFNNAAAELNQFRTNNDQAGFNLRAAELRAEVDSIWETQPKFKLSPEQRQTYTTIGGYPSLDGNYTVFGEVVEGLEVVDKIAAMETDQYDRPLKDIKMEVEIIE
jgi:cyclophilin family peptidyl-prolyl cis-trans isomerase